MRSTHGVATFNVPYAERLEHPPRQNERRGHLPKTLGPVHVTLVGSVFEADLMSISPVQILPEEDAFRTKDVLRALNNSPVIMLHLRHTSPFSLRQGYKEISRIIDNREIRHTASYVIATSYGELIRLATSAGGMHAATLLSAPNHLMKLCEAYWDDYAKHNYKRPTTGQERVARKFTLQAAFMSTEKFAKIHKRLELINAVR